jgi:DNA-binding transcriptional ArsR family regulator
MRRLLDVLCDPTRLKIVRALRDNKLAASDLARVLGRSRSATSQHLRVLREADVVRPARNGNVVRYTLASDLNAEILEDIGRAFDKLEPRTA